MLVRTVWFALACLMGLAGASVAMSVSRQVKVDQPVSQKQPTVFDDSSSDELPAPKGDRLDKIASPATISVQSVKLVPPENKEQGIAKREITSWHWHEGAKAVKRK